MKRRWIERVSFFAEWDTQLLQRLNVAIEWMVLLKRPERFFRYDNPSARLYLPAVLSP